MRIKVTGENDCARALRGLLRKAGFAVSEFLPDEVVAALPGGGYVVHIEEAPAEAHIYFDSVAGELEANLLRHVAALSPLPVTVDRPGGRVRSDRQIRILVPRGSAREAAAVEFGVLRGLLDTVHGTSAAAPPSRAQWWARLWRGRRR